MTADPDHDGESRLKVVPKHLFPDDKDYRFAVDWFIIGTVLAGADSVAKLMAATYLAQFQDLHSEFTQHSALATWPIYQPNFHVGPVPYSNLLLAHLNGVADRNLVYLPAAEKELDTPYKDNSQDAAANLEWLIQEGRQFSRLYQANKKILKEHDQRQLFNLVRDCYHRDRHLAEMFSYLEEPAVENED